MNKAWLLGLGTLVLITILFFYLRPNASSDQIAWDKSKQENTIASFEEYTQNFPAGDSIFEAYIHLDQLWWDKTKAINTSAAYEEYLQLAVPNKVYLDRAKAALATLQALDTLSSSPIAE